MYALMFAFSASMYYIPAARGAIMCCLGVNVVLNNAFPFRYLNILSTGFATTQNIVKHEK